MQEKDYLWFKEAKYGLMIHFGLYSMLEGQYKGQKAGRYSEWIQSKYQIPKIEMEELAKNFNPIYFNADEIVKFAKDMGMKYLVLTTKHHEGFCLFNSKVDDFNSYKMSICHRDFVKEISDACHRQSMKLGFYYSQDLDWHERHGGGYLSHYKENNPWWNDGTTFDNSWDFKREEGKDFDIYFRQKVLPQVKELMTNYGEISTVWFDVPATINIAQSTELRDLVKKYQPNCLINSRIGNGLYDYIALEDNEVPDDISSSVTFQDALKLKGNNPYGLFESACTLNDTWGFSYFDNKYKSVEEICNIKNKLNRQGINFLINVGPDHLGRISPESIQILKDIKKLTRNK